MWNLLLLYVVPCGSVIGRTEMAAISLFFYYRVFVLLVSVVRIDENIPAGCAWQVIGLPFIQVENPNVMYICFVRWWRTVGQGLLGETDGLEVGGAAGSMMETVLSVNGALTNKVGLVAAAILSHLVSKAGWVRPLPNGLVLRFFRAGRNLWKRWNWDSGCGQKDMPQLVIVMSCRGQSGQRALNRKKM